MREACTDRYISREYCVRRLVGLTHMCGALSSGIGVPQETGLVSEQSECGGEITSTRVELQTRTSLFAD